VSIPCLPGRGGRVGRRVLWARVSRHRQVLVVAGLAVPLAEVGHLIGHGLRIPQDGAHAYFANLLQAAGALVGVGLLAALAVLVLARILAGEVPRRKPWSFALLFSGLLFAQMGVFLVQEGLEGNTLPALATVATGLLGQQPVAFIAALAIRWLSARLGPALASLASPRRPELAILSPLLRPAPAFVVATCRAARPRRTGGQRAPPF
jgi:hypothetical protein